MDWNRLVSRIPVYRHIKNEMQKRSDIRTATQLFQRIEAAAYIERNLRGNSKYDDARRLTRNAFSVFSQFGEGGAIREILAGLKAVRNMSRQFARLSRSS